MNQLLWDKLIKLISQNIGFHIEPKYYQTLDHKIQDRIKILKLSNTWDYYHLLKNSLDDKSDNISIQQKYQGEKEWNTLANIVTNGESFFFAIANNLPYYKKLLFLSYLLEKDKLIKTNKLLILV